MNHKLILTATFLIIASMIFWWRRPSYTPTPKDTQQELIVGTNADFPPFSFIKDGTIVGFDIDIAHEVAHRLNKKLTLIDLPFIALIPELQMGAIHIIAAGMTATEERAKQVYFTRPYIQGVPLLVISLTSNPPIH